MRNFLALCGLLCLFVCGNVDEQPIAQHGISEVCPNGKVRKCTEADGALTYTPTYCYLKLGKTNYTYLVLKWLPKENILHVKGDTATGFFFINKDYAKFLIIPNNKHYRESIVTYRFFETIYYNGN